MAFDTYGLTLASAVASAGTITVAYKANRSAGSYTDGRNHKLMAMQAVFTSPKDFTVAFGASSGVITYNGSTTIPAGTTIFVQFDRVGDDEGGPYRTIRKVSDEVRPAPVYLIDLGSPLTLDADGIFDGVAAEDAALSYGTGDFKSTYDEENGLDVPRALTLVGSSSADQVCTITGEDVDGNVVVENLTANGATPVLGTKAFKKITTMAVAVGTASQTLDLGWGDVLGLPCRVPDASYIVGELKDGALLARKPGKVYLMDQRSWTRRSATGLNFMSPVAGTISKIDHDRDEGGITLQRCGHVESRHHSGHGLSVTVANSSARGGVRTAKLRPRARHMALRSGDGSMCRVQALRLASQHDIFVVSRSIWRQRIRWTGLSWLRTTRRLPPPRATPEGPTIRRRLATAPWRSCFWRLCLIRPTPAWRSSQAES